MLVKGAPGQKHYGGNIKQAWKKSHHKTCAKRPRFYRQNLRMHFYRKTYSIFIQISLKLFPRGLMYNQSALVQMTHWDGDKMAAISQTTSSNAFSWMKMCGFKSSLKYVPEVRINNIPALFQIMAWRRPGNRPLSEPMMVSFLAHICVNRPQWGNSLAANRGQAITLTNDDPFHWRIYPSPGCNELSLPMTAIWRHIAHFYSVFTLTNDDPFHWRIYPSPGWNELSLPMTAIWRHIAHFYGVFTLTNDDPFHWRIYPSPGCNELSLPMTAIWRHIAHFYGVFTLTNDDPFHWRIYPSPGCNELSLPMTAIWRHIAYFYGVFTLTNDDPFHWRIYPSPGCNELILPMTAIWRHIAHFYGVFTLTNDDPFHWRIYPSPGCNELSLPMTAIWRHIAHFYGVFTLTNDDPFHWRIYPSPGWNELSLPMTAIWRHIAHFFYGIFVCLTRCSLVPTFSAIRCRSGWTMVRVTVFRLIESRHSLFQYWFTVCRTFQSEYQWILKYPPCKSMLLIRILVRKAFEGSNKINTPRSQSSHSIDVTWSSPSLT